MPASIVELGKKYSEGEFDGSNDTSELAFAVEFDQGLRAASGRRRGARFRCQAQIMGFVLRKVPGADGVDLGGSETLKVGGINPTTGHLAIGGAGGRGDLL